MLCEECKKRPATVHLTKIVNNVKTEAHLCEECARAKGEFGFMSEPAFTFQNFLSGLFDLGQSVPAGTFPGTAVPRCPNCGLSYSDFKRLGQLGCSECYEQFHEQIQPLLRRIQAGTSHAGKVPGKSGGSLRIQREIESLREQQKAAIAREEYERAAELRDRIRELEGKLEQSR